MTIARSVTVVIALCAVLGTSEARGGQQDRRFSKTLPVWLVGNGFHSSIAVRVSDLPRSWRTLTEDPRAEHVLIGWGNARFYRSKRPGFLATCVAILGVSPSALHVVPVRGPVARRFARSDVIRFSVKEEGFSMMLAHLDRAFARNKHGQRILLGPGHLPGSRFYVGRDHFCLMQMCNVWTARVLRRAGLRISVAASCAASELAWQADRLGVREQWRRLPLQGF